MTPILSDWKTTAATNPPEPASFFHKLDAGHRAEKEGNGRESA